jgi:hypothetical protein
MGWPMAASALPGLEGVIAAQGSDPKSEAPRIATGGFV